MKVFEREEIASGTVTGAFGPDRDRSDLAAANE
jgi:hypothetical protein